MTRYVLDTNLYVQAFRSPAGAVALGQCHLSSVVLHELAGANTTVAAPWPA